MILALKRRRRDPDDGSGAVMFYSLIAAAGFAWGLSLHAF
jgi:hypothetical protein